MRGTFFLFVSEHGSFSKVEEWPATQDFPSHQGSPARKIPGEGGIVNATLTQLPGGALRETSCGFQLSGPQDLSFAVGLKQTNSV
jgi:hypothetical protein